MRHYPFILLLLLGGVSMALANKAVSPPYADVAEKHAGAIATVHPLATKAGLGILNKGGSAIDAAIAAALMLGVVDGHNSGVGGGNFALVHWADGSIEAYDGREMAPAKAHENMYVVGGELNPQLSKVGALAVAVPGSVAVYEALHKKGGKKKWKSLFKPSIKVAKKGFPLSAVTAQRIQKTEDLLARFPASAAVYLDEKGQGKKAGDIIKQKDLANTYKKLAKKGADYFYQGDFAKTVSEWMKANGGIVSEEDFSNYQFKIREPIVSEYRGYTVAGFPTPSSGGIHVAQILNILEHFDLAEMPTIDRYHTQLEAMKLAFADRAHFLGDSDFVDIPKGLISKKYAAHLAKQIKPNKVIAVRHGDPYAFDKAIFDKHTTHIAVNDAAGNWVAITTTVNTSFGSKVIVPGTGVVLNNQMDDFSMQPGVANAFGLVGAEANKIAPNKRPLSSMSPTILLKNDKPVMTLGAAGGPMIITQVVQAIINTVDLGMNVEEALSATRLHHQYLPNMVVTEPQLNNRLANGLEAKGHVIMRREFAGATQMIRVTSKGQFEAASEPRIIEHEREK